MTDTALFVHQFRIDLLRFWRNPQSRYFTVLLPIVFLLIFAAIFKGTTIVEGQTIKLTTFYVPGIMTLGIISATYVNLTQAVVTQRESGELKRVRGTPLPASFVIASRAGVGVIVAVVMSALLLMIGDLAYGVAVPAAWPALLLSVAVGAAAFACIAFAVSTQIHDAESAAPATNLTVLPLYFISGVFVPDHQIPKFLRDIAEAFPIYHLAKALRHPFVQSHGAAISGVDLLVLAVWGIGALLLAARLFRWAPAAQH